MAFTRDDLAAYEKRPQEKISDKANPFKGATPARAADAAAVAAVQSGQNLDATPGGTPAAAAAAASDPLVDDSPVVDEGDLGDLTDSGAGTSDETTSEDSSASAVDPGDESDPNTDLTGEQTTEEEVDARPAPKKGSAAERIVEVLDLAEGYKVFGKAMQEQLQAANAELARIKGGTAPAAAAVAPPVEEKDEPMPDMADADVQYDNDKYREKMSKWVKTQGRIEARRALREERGAETATQTARSVDEKCEVFAKTHEDFETVVSKNPVLLQNQLSKAAGEEVARSEYTAELLYRFGSDPAFAIRVARQTPAQQCITIGKMIGQIEAEKATPGDKKVPTAKIPATPQAGAKPAATKSITKAPPPPRPTQAGGRAAVRDVLDPSMSMEDFARQHRGSKESARAQNRKLRGLAE